MEVICEGCGVSFPKRKANPKTRYCSFECFKASRWRTVICNECGISFQKRLSEIVKATANGHRHMCSRACRNASTSKMLGGTGEWVAGGRYGPSRKRGKDWRSAKQATLRRDDYRCQQCGSEDNLEVHHWEPYFLSFDNNEDNLVTLCRPCHQEKHQEYRREGFYDDLQR